MSASPSPRRPKTAGRPSSSPPQLVVTRVFVPDRERQVQALLLLLQMQVTDRRPEESAVGEVRDGDA